MVILTIPCPWCGYRYLMAPALLVNRDGQVRQVFTADIVNPDSYLVCAACSYEGLVPEQARMMLLGAEPLTGLGEPENNLPS